MVRHRKEPLTERQKEVVRAIEKLTKNAVSPTIQELCDHLGIVSKNGVASHLRAMARKGALEPCPPRASRCIMLDYTHPDVRGIPDRGDNFQVVSPRQAERILKKAGL